MRGSRVHGYGRVSGGHRKSGQRGGKGKAGKRDHHWIRTIQAGEIKKRGFTRHSANRRIQSINVGDLDRSASNWVDKDLATQDNSDRIAVDLNNLGLQKLLGSGQISTPMVIQVDTATARAVEKVKAAGGEVILRESSLSQ